MRRTIFLSSFLLLPVLFPLGAQAAQIYLDPASGKYAPGVPFSVDVRLDNQNQCVNAAEVDVTYPKSLLEAMDVSEGNSIFSLWIKEPTIYKDYGVVSFIGGLPGGYCGRAAGDPSLSNKLATIIFRFPTSTAPSSSSIPQTAQLSFTGDTKAILNDGLGTIAKTVTAGASYTQILKGQYAPVDVWQQAIQNDATPPEAFRVGVFKDQDLFEGNLFAVFSTVDKQTGIDHYEVAEVPQKDVALPENQWKWTRAVSPYLIKNQNLDGNLEVRAIDKAGNERVAEYYFRKLPPTIDWRLSLVPYLATIGIVGFVIIQVALRLIF